MTTATPEKKEDAKTKKKITFYLYDQQGKLATRMKIVYSPFNEISRGRVPSEDTYRSPRKIEFKAGVYETDNEQDIECLDMWNEGGELSNGKFFQGDTTHRVKRDAPLEKGTVTEKKVEVKIETIPYVIASTMTHEQLTGLAKAWGVTIGDVPEGTKPIAHVIDMLEQSGHISK